MATIIEFRAKTLRPHLMGPPMPSEPADVVLFPGVRYERADAAVEKPPVQRRRSRRRDRLTLDD